MLDLLGEAALRTVLLAGVVQCSLWGLRVRRAGLLLAAWTLVLTASLSMPLLLRATPLRLPLDPALSGALIDGAADLLQQPARIAPPSLPASVGEGAIAAQTQPSLRWWLGAVYLVVCCGLVLRVVLGVGLSMRLLARSVPVRPAWAAGMWVRVSREVAGPVTIARVIVLPADAVDWPEETRQAVLAHERAHVARFDFAMLILSQLNRALFWFSPMSWWLHRRLVALTELASDDQAIACTRDRLGYAEILLEMGRRCGPMPRGPAMARLSTLPQRIDRILLDPAIPSFTSRRQQVLITAGVAGLSLAVAGLTPGAVSNRMAANEREIAPTLHDADAGGAIEQGNMARHADLPGEAAQGTMPPAVKEAAAEAPARLSPAIAAPAPSPVAPMPPRTALRTSTTKAAVVPPPHVTAAPRQAAPGRGGREDESGPQSSRSTATQTPMATGFEVASRSDRQAMVEAHSPLPHQFSDGSVSPAPAPEFEAVAGSTCTGVLQVGLRAWQGSFNRHPDVVAGQKIPVQAQFFRRANGTSWVRFDVFGRPPLDLPVRFARSGMTWTGEYGISYTVRDMGGRSLTGLAALVANDSARLDLACAKSATHLF
jgi:beta-lactamase regulating signal transducer with metallopeptidase domain